MHAGKSKFNTIRQESKVFFCLQLTQLAHAAKLAHMWSELSRIVVIFFVSLMVSQVYAQSAPEGAELEASESKEVEEEPVNSDIDTPLAKMENISASEGLAPKEMRSKAGDIIREMQSWQQGLAQALGDARKDQNILMMNCINPLLTRVKGFLSIVNSAVSNLTTLVAAENDSDAGHEFDKIAMAFEKAQSAHSQRESCVTTEDIWEGEDGDTELEVEVVSEEAEEGTFDTSDEADQIATEGTDIGDEEWMEEFNSEVARKPASSPIQ